MFEKKKSRCFVVSGISEVCSIPNKTVFSRQKHTIPNNKGYKKYPNKPVLGRSRLPGDFGEKSHGPNKKVFAGVCVCVCVCVDGLSC